MTQAGDVIKINRRGLRGYEITIEHGEFLRNRYVRAERQGKSLLIAMDAHDDGDQAQSQAIHWVNGMSARECSLELRGNFILIEVSKEIIRIYTDCVSGSNSFVVEQRDEILLARCFVDAVRNSKPNPNKCGLASYLLFRRVYSSDTIIEGVRFMESNYEYTWSKSGFVGKRYWAPALNRVSCPDKIAKTISEAVNRCQRTGLINTLMMSGGFDSRVVLACMDSEEMECVSTSLVENRETLIARRCAEAVNKRYRFVERDPDMFGKRFREAISLCGISVYNESQFIGYGRAGLTGRNMMTGLGLDIIMRGLYLPWFELELMGRQTGIRLLRRINDSRDQYFRYMRYRYKGSWLKLISCETLDSLVDMSHINMGSTINEGIGMGLKKHKVWDHLNLHSLSRHYSYPMINSMNTYAAVSTPGYTREMIELGYRIDDRQRVGGKLYREVANRLNSELFGIDNANNNYPAKYSERRVAVQKSLELLSSKILGKKMNRRNPQSKERSWPNIESQLRLSHSLMERVKRLGSSERLQSLEILNMDGVSGFVNEFVEERSHDAAMANMLLTLDGLLDCDL